MPLPGGRGPGSWLLAPGFRPRIPAPAAAPGPWKSRRSAELPTGRPITRGPSGGPPPSPSSPFTITLPRARRRAASCACEGKVNRAPQPHPREGEWLYHVNWIMQKFAVGAA
ncbi:hypothetical protein KNE206_10130 [Kitasatospora sp. NE20-6]